MGQSGADRPIVVTRRGNARGAKGVGHSRCREISSRINIGKEVWYLTQEEVVAAGVTEQDILRLTLDALVAHVTLRAESDGESRR